jgi:DNA-directed RNA polymerase specialized sigma24 family protein
VVAYGAAAVRAGRALTGDWHAGSDLAQESLTRLYLAWPRLRDEAAAWTYLRRTMVRVHLRQRRRSWTGEIPTGDVPAVAAPGNAAGGDDEVLAALSTLAPGQRATLVLRFCLDMSVEDTAAALRCTTGTVKSQTSKGLAALRVRLHSHAEKAEVE